MRSGALILHDDEPTLGLVRRILGEGGYDVSHVTSAYRAVAPSVPDMSFVVLGASAIDDREIEVVAALRARWPKAWILVLYPIALRERAARALALGADATLPEPFYPGELAAFVRRATEVAAARAASDKAAATAVATAHAAAHAADRAAALAADRAAAQSVGAPRTQAAVPASHPPPQARRTDPVEQLAGGVAHSIRNPLQILELQLGTVETEGTVDVPGMREQLLRVASVVESLMRFAGHRHLAMRPVDVDQLVARVFAPTKGAEGAELVVVPAHGRAEVLAAADLLRVGLESLRNRAERVTPAGGAIEVATRVRSDDGRRVIEIAVTDGGPLLSDERRTHLFDPYPDADAVQDGTGLELAGLAGIVRDHGGSTLALPGPRGGTTILVRLPARPERELESEGSSAADTILPRGPDR